MAELSWSDDDGDEPDEYLDDDLGPLERERPGEECGLGIGVTGGAVACLC